MHRRFIVYFLVIACITLSIYTVGKVTGVFHRVTLVKLPPINYKQTVVLLPLDSRPACTQFVEQLARLANIRVLIPPLEYLDNYTQPSNRHALAVWLRENTKYSDAAIVSTDMLLSGSLLASRSNIPTQADLANVADLLTAIRHDNPKLHLYTFHIIPRLLIADHSPDKIYQKSMQKYSILQNQVLLFENPLDYKKLTDLENSIPSRVIDQHRLLYTRNEEAHRAWISLAKANVLDGVVIGQDDGYHFGLPNLVKQRLTSSVEHEHLADKVIITRGTDEVALTVLGRLALERSLAPKVYVEYSTAEAPSVVMPFMPHSVSTTVTEKLHLIGACEVSSPDNADFTLFVHIGRNNSTPFSLKASAERLRDYVNQGRSVALVDLTEDYYAWQTLLPYATSADVALHKLTAYASWNTTSNSVGTAITQAALFSANKSSESSSLRLYYDNLTFLIARLLDDYHYLKEIQPEINQRLSTYGTDPYHLESRRGKTEKLISRSLAERSRILTQSLSKPIYLPGFEQPFFIQQIDNKITLPWDRTFEIKIEPQISLIQVLPKE